MSSSPFKDIVSAIKTQASTELFTFVNTDPAQAHGLVDRIKSEHASTLTVSDKLLVLSRSPELGSTSVRMPLGLVNARVDDIVEGLFQSCLDDALDDYSATVNMAAFAAGILPVARPVVELAERGQGKYGIKPEAVAKTRQAFEALNAGEGTADDLKAIINAPSLMITPWNSRGDREMFESLGFTADHLMEKVDALLFFRDRFGLRMYGEGGTVNAAEYVTFLNKRQQMLPVIEAELERERAREMKR